MVDHDQRQVQRRERAVDGHHEKCVSRLVALEPKLSAEQLERKSADQAEQGEHQHVAEREWGWDAIDTRFDDRGDHTNRDGRRRS
jgi:hypothetical protein